MNKETFEVVSQMLVDLKNEINKTFDKYDATIKEMSASVCTKCGDEVQGEENSFCGNCAHA